MLALSTLHTLLSQIITPSSRLHTAILSTPSGHLVCYASERPKDEIRVIVGLSGEVWQETLSLGPGAEDEKERMGMVSSELGRILVVPVDSDEPHALQTQPRSQPPTPTTHSSTTSASTITAGRNRPLDLREQTQEYTPLMLLTLNASEEVEWEELQLKGKALAAHIAKPLSKYREHLQGLSTPSSPVKTPPVTANISGTNPLSAR
ncbi:hypothetical protein V5O48_004714 [Marasmius crinis-equi]|uniref:Uncharacterized protein n=1 Tax=Marasmius crinis-equi TaxID=585013 RepID=A0ABR3FQA5_9AGAR